VKVGNVNFKVNKILTKTAWTRLFGGPMLPVTHINGGKAICGTASASDKAG